MFEQAFRNIDDVLRKEAGCTTELDYTEQTSWLLFLKYLDALEQDKATEAELDGKKYGFILDKPYRWDSWAAPKDKDGQLDHNKAMTGDDLTAFVNGKLFLYLHGFKTKATGPNTIEYKIGEIFGEINLADIQDKDRFDVILANPPFGGKERRHEDPQGLVLPTRPRPQSRQDQPPQRRRPR